MSRSTRALAVDKTRDRPSVLSVNLKVVCNLASDHDIELYGIIEGDIRSRRLRIDAEAYIDGSIRAETVEIFGTVVGRIEAISVYVGNTAQVVGTIFHHEISIEKGAYLEGLQPWRPIPHLMRRLNSVERT